jgi:broad specificity phosphatase PhoE
MIFAIRHGQRADDPLAKDLVPIELEFDPPLSKNGILQAKLTGIYMREMIERMKGGPKKVIVLSSPFLRCIQTAINLADGLANFHKETIYICDEIAEIQKTKFFKKDVLPDLHFRQEKMDLKYFELPDGRVINVKEKSFLKKSSSTTLYVKNAPMFPEAINDCFLRFKKARKNITQKYLKKSLNDVIVILVTHSIGVQCLIHELEPEKEIPQIDYCSLTQINHKVDVNRREVSEEISLKNFIDHIKIKERE